ncbi:ATPase [Planotetraspora silvatica]|uniref:ATPase n=2 Tax=Planotetraspora silvatica TaxID=234614 RepID=A0A8J3URS9_9ACTN|nr:ATPase [Planotetraspora silvatica]
MAVDEHGALSALTFNWVSGFEDVWHPSPFHVEALNLQTVQAVLDGVGEATRSTDTSPIGLVVQGQRGAGKTHLLGWIREKVQEEGGYFFLVELLDAGMFWENVVGSVLDGLSRELDGESQLKAFLRRLSSQVGVPRMMRRAVIGDAPLTVEVLDGFMEALERFDGHVGRESKEAARALVLRASMDRHARDVGDAWLISQPEEEQGERARWGMRRGQRSPQEVVRSLSRLLALTGPSVIAIDQIDTLVAAATAVSDHRGRHDQRDALVIEQIAGGLMTLKEITRRTLTVVSCITPTWVYIKKNATDTVQDRFRETIRLKAIPDVETGRTLIERRLGAQYRAIGFRPPHPTWPVKPTAFDSTPGLTPRQLLIRIDAHIRSCRASGEITELGSFDGGDVSTSESSPEPRFVVPEADLGRLDVRFAELRGTAQVSADAAAALDPAAEDTMMPALLAAGLAAWVAEQGKAGTLYSQDAPPSAKPPLHARLRRSLDEATEDEEHWSFRAIAATNAIAALTRIRGASVAAGLNPDVRKRRLFLLRNTEWSGGAKTREAVAAFERAGGRTLRVEVEDLKILAALRALLKDNPPDLQAWLAARRPTSEIKLLDEALGDVWTVPSGMPGAGGDTATPDPVAAMSGDSGRGRADVPAGDLAPETPAVPGVKRASAVSDGSADAPSIVIGTTVGQVPARVDLEALRKHTSIFAGSGSGKTVLIRRLIEECALKGVSAIVLDPNNDLARLGDGWPEPPAGWRDGDADRAERYLADTDVTVWTPGRVAGRPLAFQPLPDFSGVMDDADEFREAVGAAVSSLVPRAKLEGNTQKAHRSRAVLKEAVEYYGRHGTAGLHGLIALLSELPEGVSTLANADKIAGEIAQNLTATMVSDPLFGGEGAAADPGVLLTPPPGKRARISVISFVGLPSDEQRQSFVNLLQLALFSWIRRHPAGDRPLGGLFVMDEAQTFAPSGAMTACTHSTLALASQARKYGLGLVFATQAPRGLHNRIPGNSATQFFGLLNSPAQIEAAKEVARSKNSTIGDVGRLGPGEFYAGVEGTAFARIQAPMCLSHHPRSPLTTEEVIQRARKP